MQGNTALRPEYGDYFHRNVLEPEAQREISRWISAHEEPIHISPAQGALLQAIVASSNSRRILEIGTHVGYSAIWLGEAAQSVDGLVTSIEIDPVRAQHARDNIRNAGLSNFVTVFSADARDWLEQCSDEFDLVFLDAEKVLYMSLFERAFELLRPGGTLVADNTLHKGRILDPQTTGSRAISALNQIAFSGELGFGTVIPIGDGMTMIVKSVKSDPA